eukprot:CAMPEP_0181465652 /NCGR_PEP_ID=MMETSP1110-20121109/36060_1 /TAXON_ID=174948 /ORGANISM="Symbiodinium sp., Strain CCMP421" /LENGTH=85 /DNA_ID=CAMNT_0023590427 /DNA_START=142 /DNA_END=398 /DNA_ORIENTATION=+
MPTPEWRLKLLVHSKVTLQAAAGAAKAPPLEKKPSRLLGAADTPREALLGAIPISEEGGVSPGTLKFGTGCAGCAGICAGCAGGE